MSRAVTPHAFTSDDETTAAVFATRGAVALCRAAERDQVQTLARSDMIEQATGRHHVTAAAVFDQLVRGSRRADLGLAGLLRRLVTDHVRHPHLIPRAAGTLDAVKSTEEVANGLRVTHSTVGDAVVVQAGGEVDQSTSARLGAALRTGGDAARPPGPLVIDLTGIRFFAAAGLTQLDIIRRYCRERQVTLKVVAGHRSVLLPLRITGLDVLFDIAPTLEEATRPHRT